METFVFIIAAAAVLAGAVGVVANKNPVYSALSLVGTLFGVAILFLVQEAHFLAAVQIIVYAGAIVVLFLFVIMLLGVDRAEDLSIEPIVGQRAVAGVLGIVIAALPIAALASTDFQATGMRSNLGSLRQAALEGVPDVSSIGNVLFTRYIFAFEITSVLLIIAVVGAVALSRKSRLDEEIEIEIDDPFPAPEPADDLPAGDLAADESEVSA